MQHQPEIRVGTMAWSYEDWRGVFYPEELKTAELLPFYARHFPLVEVDSTFYATPKRETVRHWAEITPPDFRFTAKMPQAITHEAQLRNCERELETFLQAIGELRGKLGAVLIQLPPSFHRDQDEGALRKFLRWLPGGIPFSVEFRGSGWHTPAIIHLLEEHAVGWAWTDASTIEEPLNGPFQPLPLTSDVLYLRLLGDLTTKYLHGKPRAGTYRRLQWLRDEAIASWALKVGHHLEQIREVYVVCGNHYEGCSPLSAQRVAAAFGLPVPEFPSKTEQGAGQLELL